MTKAFIKDIAYYLPEKVLTNEQLAAEFPEWMQCEFLTFS